MKKRVKREIERVGYPRFLDVLAFRLYYKFFLAAKDESGAKKRLKDSRTFIRAERSSNSHYAQPEFGGSGNFFEGSGGRHYHRPLQNIAQKKYFTLAKTGTVVFHPGVCPNTATLTVVFGRSPVKITKKSE
jgi:hypothetical protein